jgi:hypothetical protein
MLADRLRPRYNWRPSLSTSALAQTHTHTHTHTHTQEKSSLSLVLEQVKLDLPELQGTSLHTNQISYFRTLYERWLRYMFMCVYVSSFIPKLDYIALTWQQHYRALQLHEKHSELYTCLHWNSIPLAPHSIRQHCTNWLSQVTRSKFLWPKHAKRLNNWEIQGSWRVHACV